MAVEYRCDTHGIWDATKASGCPECVRVLRHENKMLKIAFERYMTAAELHNTMPFDLATKKQYDEAKINAKQVLYKT